MKCISITDPTDKVDALQFNLAVSEIARPPGLMLFDNGWNIDGNNGRFIVKPGEWVITRHPRHIEILSTEEFHRRFRRDNREDKIEVTRGFLEEIRAVIMNSIKERE